MKSINQSKLVWVKASRSADSGTCLEVSKLPDGGIAVRDSKQQGRGPVLSYTTKEWDAFLDGAKKGEFDHFLNS